MKIYHNGVDYNVDLLYGYSPIVDRGIVFNETIDGIVGFIDRGLNSVTSSITIQGDEDVMFTIDTFIKDQLYTYVKLDAGEYIFGADKSRFYAGSSDVMPMYVAVLNKGVMVRKNLKQYSIQLSLGIGNNALVDDTIFDYSTEPNWDEDIRFEAGYSAGSDSILNSNTLLDGSYNVSGNGSNRNVTLVNAVMTTEEIARWRRSWITGGNRIYNSVDQSDMYMKLFGQTSLSEYKFYVRSFTETHMAFDQWNVTLELILRNNAST